MKNKERIAWILLVLIILVITAAPGLNNWIFAGDQEKAYKHLRLFNEVFNLLRTEYYDESKAIPENLIEGAIKGMVSSLDDPHTSYLPEESFRELQTDTRGEFGGLGIVIGVRDKWITVISPIEGTPADKAGIKAGDRIIKIEGSSTQGFTTMDAVKLLRGELGTDVTITVKRESEEQPIQVTITRGIIELETVKSTVINKTIGYIRIVQFSEPTPQTMKQHINNLRSKGINSIIVDLRNNPGGLLSAVIEICNMFLEEGVIVSTRGRDPSQNQVFHTSPKTLVPEMPLIVMVNEGSASASEIFAAAIKENNRGVLVGEQTFGKGSVQTVRELPGGAGIRITTALYHAPSGKSIEERGVMPDEVVHDIEITKEEMERIDKIKQQNLIENFVEKHESYTEEQFEKLLQNLKQKDLEIRPAIVKKLIRNEKEKYKMPSMVDLDYDVQLRHAVNMLKSISLLLKKEAS
ncbi:MAG: S41 family peptidase [Spirochaetota bacterium]